MDGEYLVTRAGQTVGRVLLCREGLYYRISCRCDLTDGEIHRLYADEENLGVLIPDSGELKLETKVAVKRILPGSLFTLEGNPQKWIPIHTGEPFEALDKLRTGKLVIRDGKMGLQYG